MRCRQGDAQMPTWKRPAVDKGVPIIGVDYGYLWSRAPEASDTPHDEVAGEDLADGVRTSSQVLCGRCSVDRWLFGHLCQAKGTTSGIVPCSQRSCKLEATHGWSCAAMVSLRCWHT